MIPTKLIPPALFVALTFSTFSFAQTANCTNWTFFAVPGGGRTLASGINRWDTVVGYTLDNSSTHNLAGFIRWAKVASATTDSRDPRIRCLPAAMPKVSA